ncbi:AmmeMemoRadiSam system radical SAM enzyme [Maribellus maritimus]|uniref:AmmeMemoRadiSam system radical SAM enzyme n=1 Tax=Maribellus maritimus TaxID=2870838 RepID=UPI001EEB88FA|nr:AmmeMemoRadiSam system radical SAM enzyme [Maribellus maritimus]MCG6186470.1 AmmeMemoRadiSam system radical SAM enzyme [Maribellus maritimus]
MYEALFYTKLEDGTVKCELCPWNCILKVGQTGFCKVRENIDGKLITLVYNKVAALGVDPIEKKPLYHFFPGKNILSIGEVGCNLRCNFCQNHRISQCRASDFKGFHKITPEEIITEALKTFNNIGIAYTYNEPLTFYEFLLDTAKLAKPNGLKNVIVSNGYINPQPLKELLPFIDAFNIDLKAFTAEFYIKQTKGKLNPVLETLKIIANSKAHLEITNLIVPELNDDEKQFEKMVQWIASELSCEVPLHLSRYFPQHELSKSPTPIETLDKLYDIAKKYLRHVYLGNVSDEKRSSTVCCNCQTTIVTRNRYDTLLKRVDSGGLCKNCGTSNNIVY